MEPNFATNPPASSCGSKNWRSPRALRQLSSAEAPGAALTPCQRPNAGQPLTHRQSLTVCQRLASCGSLTLCQRLAPRWAGRWWRCVVGRAYPHHTPISLSLLAPGRIGTNVTRRAYVAPGARCTPWLGVLLYHVRGTSTPSVPRVTPAPRRSTARRRRSAPRCGTPSTGYSQTAVSLVADSLQSRRLGYRWAPGEAV